MTGIESATRIEMPGIASNGAHTVPTYSRRDLLLGATMTAVTMTARAAAPRFDVDRFVEDCKQASVSHTRADAQPAIREVFARAISDPKSVLQAVGPPERGGLRTLYRAPNLTILNIVWSPLMQLVPHE